MTDPEPTTPKPSGWRQLRTLLWREWRLEWRTRETVIATGVFAALVVLILTFSVSSSDASRNASVQAALLWITFVFATTLGIGRAFAREREAGAMNTLLLAPLDWSLIYVAKVLSTVTFTVVTQLLTLALFVVFLNLELSALQLLQLAGLIVAVTTGHAAVGLLLGGMTVGLRAREVLLPVLLFPLLIPLFLGALRGTVLILTDGLIVADPTALTTEWVRWLAMIGAFDVVYFALGLVLFPFVIR